MNKKNKLEEKWDYANYLLIEIHDNISKLINFKWKEFKNWLDLVNKKIDFARKHWLYVDSYDKEILRMRLVLFKRNVENKIEQINETWSNYSFDIIDLEKEYDELIKEKDINHSELTLLMNKLKTKIFKNKIMKQVQNVDLYNVSNINFEKIIDEIKKAKKMWIDVSDLEKEIFK